MKIRKEDLRPGYYRFGTPETAQSTSYYWIFKYVDGTTGNTLSIYKDGSASYSPGGNIDSVLASYDCQPLDESDIEARWLAKAIKNGKAGKRPEEVILDTYEIY